MFLSAGFELIEITNNNEDTTNVSSKSNNSSDSNSNVELYLKHSMNILTKSQLTYVIYR